MPSRNQLSRFGAAMTLAEPLVAAGTEFGEVFTRRWVVDLILDLVGYTPDRDLASLAVVEPSCGTGAFLVPLVERLMESARRHGRDLRSLTPALRAFDLLQINAERARSAAAGRLHAGGLSIEEAEDLAASWVHTGDFLLHDHPPKSADVVVGNPPYIRLEDVPRHVMDAYRRACPTMRGRSDIYVGFIEVGLDLLKPDGVLGFICADRWMRNQYGADLRTLISSSYAVDTVLTMHDVDAFEDDVSAYPAIVILRNQPQSVATVIETNGAFNEADAPTVTSWVRKRRSRTMTTANFQASKLNAWFDGRDLWPTGTPVQLAMLADLEKRFPPLQDPRTGTRVGIGVATGCDQVYITKDTDLVEPDRLLPLLQALDTTGGTVHWSGGHLINPWDEAGLVRLADYPRLGDYLDTHNEQLRARHIAAVRPAQWYRTIDRVDPNLLGRPKLVLPDLKAASHPVLDEGSFYPHHNLYFVVSDAWDLEVLGGLLLSDVANMFVGAYCVRMRGGCYRFQAQYVRRMRVPYTESISRGHAADLRRAFRARDRDAATAVAARLYGLDVDMLGR